MKIWQPWYVNITDVWSPYSMQCILTVEILNISVNISVFKLSWQVKNTCLILYRRIHTFTFWNFWSPQYWFLFFPPKWLAAFFSIICFRFLIHCLKLDISHNIILLLAHCRFKNQTIFLNNRLSFDYSKCNFSVVNPHNLVFQTILYNLRI